MDCNGKKKQDASNIIRKSLHNWPNLKKFLEVLFQDVELKVDKVGNSYPYPMGVYRNKVFHNYGMFMDLFICKHLSNQYQKEFIDRNAEVILKHEDVYFTEQVKKKILPKTIEKNYKILKDSKCRALDSVESLKIVSLSAVIYFYDLLPERVVDVDVNILPEIVNYFEKLAYSEVDIKRNIGCKYFEGTADIIFDNEVIYEIKTSQYKFLKHSQVKFEMEFFYKLILYGFGYYKDTGKVIKYFKIYNPILGYLYQIKINDIDMEHFEEVLEEDAKNLKDNLENPF